jgi:predicted nucleotidyltransferase
LGDPLAEAFDIFDQRVQPSTTQRLAADERSEEISLHLSKYNQVLECRLMGSIGRSTAIKHFSDVDILVVFSSRDGVGERRPKDLLDQIEQYAESINCGSIRRGTTISLQYPDWPNVDILPAFTFEAGSKHETFLIPGEASQDWQRYSPAKHDHIVQSANIRLGARFKQVVRGIKWWSRVNGNVVPSFEIETLLSELFVADIPTYAEAIYSIFDAINDYLTGVDSTGENVSIEEGKLKKVRTACHLARQAREISFVGNNKHDLEVIFRRLFGGQFPVVSD